MALLVLLCIVGLAAVLGRGYLIRRRKRLRAHRSRRYFSIDLQEPGPPPLP